MAKTFKSYMKTWVRMLNESKYSCTEDDNLEVNEGEDSNDAQTAYDEYLDDLEKGADPEGNVEKLSEDISDAEKERIRRNAKMAKAAAEKDAEKFDAGDDESKAKVKVKIVDGPYDGYCKCEITYKDGTKEEKEYEFTDEQISATKDALFNIARKRGLSKKTTLFDDDDAIVALVQTTEDPDYNLEWSIKVPKGPDKDLDEWIFAGDDEMFRVTNRIVRGAKPWNRNAANGLKTDDYGDEIDEPDMGEPEVTE